MKLWRVWGEAQVDVVIATEDEKPSHSYMQNCVHDEFIDNMNFQSWSVGVSNEIKSEADLPSGWDEQCEAYGRLDNLYIDQILDVIRQEEKAREDAEKNERDQVKLFED